MRNRRRDFHEGGISYRHPIPARRELLTALRGRGVPLAVRLSARRRAAIVASPAAASLPSLRAFRRQFGGASKMPLLKSATEERRCHPEPDRVAHASYRSASDMPGWVIDCGYLRRLDPWEDVPAPPSIRTAAIAAPPPRVYAVAVAGKWPRPSNVQRIRLAVDAIPAKLLRAWIRAGGRLEIVPGRNASVHPRFSSDPPAAGWNKFHRRFASWLATCRRPLTAAHEIGHARRFRSWAILPAPRLDANLASGRGRRKSLGIHRAARPGGRVLGRAIRPVVPRDAFPRERSRAGVYFGACVGDTSGPRGRNIDRGRQGAGEPPGTRGRGHRPRCPKCGCSAKLDSGDCVHAAPGSGSQGRSIGGRRPAAGHRQRSRAPDRPGPPCRDDCERFISHKDLRPGKYRQIRTPRKRRWNPIAGRELRSVLLQRLKDRPAGGTGRPQPARPSHYNG